MSRDLYDPQSIMCNVHWSLCECVKCEKDDVQFIINA